MKKLVLDSLLLVSILLLSALTISSVWAEDPEDPKLLAFINEECPISETDPGDCRVYILVWNNTIQEWIMPENPTIFEGRCPTTLVYTPPQGGEN